MSQRLIGMFKKYFSVIVLVAFFISGAGLGAFLHSMTMGNMDKSDDTSIAAPVKVLSQPVSAPQIDVITDGPIDINLSKLNEEDLSSVTAFLQFKKIKQNLIPTGVPAVYGNELSVSFDNVQPAIDLVSQYDLTYGQNKISLDENQMGRYISIGLSTACEYCCGATALVDDKGMAACGCAHSQMMRGLAAYLIKNHPEMSDQQILDQLNKWKVTYFPKDTLSAYLQQLKEGGDQSIGNLLNEFPDFLPQMVGGC